MSSAAVYERLSFDVLATFAPSGVEKLGLQKLRVDTQGVIFAALMNVAYIAETSVVPGESQDGLGGQWRVECTLSRPLNPAEYTHLQSAIRGALASEQKEAPWLQQLAPEWHPAIPPG